MITNNINKLDRTYLYLYRAIPNNQKRICLHVNKTAHNRNSGRRSVRGGRLHIRIGPRKLRLHVSARDGSLSGAVAALWANAQSLQRAVPLRLIGPTSVGRRSSTTPRSRSVCQR